MVVSQAPDSARMLVPLSETRRVKHHPEGAEVTELFPYSCPTGLVFFPSAILLPLLATNKQQRLQAKTYYRWNVTTIVLPLTSTANVNSSHGKHAYGFLHTDHFPHLPLIVSTKAYIMSRQPTFQQFFGCQQPASWGKIVAFTPDEVMASSDIVHDVGHIEFQIYEPDPPSAPTNWDPPRRLWPSPVTFTRLEFPYSDFKVNCLRICAGCFRYRTVALCSGTLRLEVIRQDGTCWLHTQQQR